jgi:hypothetical protein
MLAALNALKGQLKLNKKLEDLIKGKDKSKGKGKGMGKDGNKRTKNKKDNRHKTKHKEDKAWKKVPPPNGDKMIKEVGIVVSITWHGACTSRLNAACAKSSRRNSKRQSQPMQPALPLTLPLLLQSLTRTSRLSLPPLAQPCMERTKKNDGASQHAYRHI